VHGDLRQLAAALIEFVPGDDPVAVAGEVSELSAVRVG
jgi:hypothetical protein